MTPMTRVLLWPLSAVAAALLLVGKAPAAEHALQTIAPPEPERRAAAAPPNIIFILADDLGYGHVGFNGQTLIATPNIDRLAMGGLRFTHAYAGSPVCAPARATLMTGLHTGHARVRGNSGVHGRVSLRPDDLTVAEVLKQAGYRTAAIGKWGLGEAGTRGVPNMQGFDEWLGYLNQDHALRYYPSVLWENQGQIFPQLNQGGRQEAYSHDLFTERALDFLSRNASGHFFLYLAYTVPHADSELSRNTGDGYIVPDYGAYADRDWPRPAKGFAAMVSRLDRDIGRIVDQVKALGIEEETLVIFSSDNGPAREGTLTPAFFSGTGPFRGMKGTLYEGGIRVPFVARWAGRVAPGTTTDRPVAFWDVLPTAADLADLPIPSGLDGVSFAPTLLGRSQPARDSLYWEHRGEHFAQAVRLAEWKALRPAPSAPTELYRLSDDPGEQRDRAGDFPEIVKKVEAIMRAAHVDSADFPVHPDGLSP